MQAGDQLERLTGGAVLSGLHEVVVLPEVAAQAREAIERGETPIRVSHTCFIHAGSYEVLQPLGRFATPEATRGYPPILAGVQVERELGIIGLSSPELPVA